MREKIAEAFMLLERIPVSGPQVDTMFRVRVLLAEVGNALAAEADKSAPASPAGSLPPTAPPEREAGKEQSN